MGWKVGLAALAVIVLVFVMIATAQARPLPEGTFSTQVQGTAAAFTFGPEKFIKPNYEVTLGVWCFRPDGSQILMGNRNNPYVYEFNQFGGWDNGSVVTLDVAETADCTARLVAVEWAKGNGVQAWTLDEGVFQTSQTT